MYVIVFNSTFAVGMVKLSHIHDFYMAHIHSGAKGVNGCVSGTGWGRTGRHICMALSTGGSTPPVHIQASMGE